jgi:hypothetical protein
MAMERKVGWAGEFGYAQAGYDAGSSAESLKKNWKERENKGNMKHGGDMQEGQARRCG